MLPDFNPNQINKLDDAHQVIKVLLNMVEELKQENETLRHEVQQLRDEVNRLKGEQGKPDIKPSKKTKSVNYSSERERHQPKSWQKSSKVDKIQIDREEKRYVDQRLLPEDAQFKGHEAVIVQDIQLGTDNIQFLKEKFYSPSQRSTYLAELPVGYTGEFGPGIHTLVLTLYYGGEMTEPKIVELLRHLGIFISEGQVSNLLTKKKDMWHQEKDAVYRAGLASGSWQHIDDTSTRVNGENQYCHVLCNPLYTAYFTRPDKDRLTIISLLQNVTEPVYMLNETTAAWLALFSTPQWAQQVIATWTQEQPIPSPELEAWIEICLGRLNKQQQARIKEAAALTAYYHQADVPIIPTLLSDDAPQFRFIIPDHALCWVHEGRHYKKLMPFIVYHQQLLLDFLQQFWAYYHDLQAYRNHPTPKTSVELEQRFDKLFSQETGYDELDKRIAITKQKKDRLLKVLQHPEIPLHNNPAELAARRRVRKRDISFGPRTADGVAAWDTFMTLAATAKKLHVSFYAYIYDRVAGVFSLPSLADLIQQQAPAFHPVLLEKPS